MFAVLIVKLAVPLIKRISAPLLPTVILFSTLLVAGCSSNPVLVDALLTDHTLSTAAELQGLAHFPQQDNQCGPASLATMLAYNNISVRPEALRPYLYIPDKQGTLAIELEAKARQYGLIVYPLEPQLKFILRELDAGHPVLVMQNLGFSWFPQWHFAVAIGYDLDAQQIYLRSGPDKRYPTDLSLFLKTWNRANNWARVILPTNRFPATVDQQRYVKAANTLEQLGVNNATLTTSAFEAYQTTLKRWPRNTAALMGLGNISYARQEYNSAVDYYIRYIEKSVAPEAGWNNLSYALMQTGCIEAALKSVRCAISIAPDQANYQNSLAELSSISGQKNTAKNCELPICITSE
ncbi:PA2778 family cysteine peptidase [Amphritea japonica]|uniref:Peptidase C39 n=1 Tax=Amphritea japonica ATCC BAA-1530 TaxID=1278309 RepID=A0A7R6SSH7_9GAMM|nr:PA2778 family cysteine peptidase [Amphritea japonica]BBB25650.1 peptidase C39 [Amphritea japonica ATCC BAA-1530]